MTDDGPAQPALRVLCWNVRDMLGDPLAVHRVVRAARPDVACLQEVSRRPLSRSRLAALARATGLLFTCGGRAGGGTAVLTSLRTRVDDAAAGRLPVQGVLTRRRGWAGATVRLPGGGPLVVTSVHLGLDERERADHVRCLLDLRVPACPPAAVVGDLNEPPGGPSWRVLGERLADACPDGGPTFPARRPRRRIDAVLVDARVQVLGCGFPQGVSAKDVLAASDHLPVLASLVPPPSA
ncbi:endonuclease/exonuclease/phosphatase family protein [Thalassiella azotivora]